MMTDALGDVCSEHNMPESWGGFCKAFGAQTADVASLYLHDYDNEEICTSIGMCDAAELGITESAGV